MAAAEIRERFTRDPGFRANCWQVFPCKWAIGHCLIELVDPQRIMSASSAERIAFVSGAHIAKGARINQTGPPMRRILHAQSIRMSVSGAHRAQWTGINHN